MKSQYEKGRERLTSREREEVWDRILQRMGRRRVWSLPRLTLATAGVCAVVALVFLLHPMNTRIERERGGRPDAPAQNETVDQVATSSPAPATAQRIPEPQAEMGEMKAAAPGGANSPVVTTATPAGPSRAVAAKVAEEASPVADATGTEPPSEVGAHEATPGEPPAATSTRSSTRSLARPEASAPTASPPTPAATAPIPASVPVTGSNPVGDETPSRDLVESTARPAPARANESPLAWGAKPGLQEAPGRKITLHDGTQSHMFLLEGDHSGSARAIVPQPPSYPTTGGSTLPNDEVYDSMYFEHYGVNPFIPTDEDPLSTFAVDVDAASYTVARRYIDLGHLPPKEAVRVEEFVNYFRQDYPDFADTDFRIFLEGAPSPFGKGYHLLRIGLKARTVDDRDRLPANLVFVIDHSGSMAREDRLELVKQALHILVDRLNPQDRIGIVTYDTNGEILLDPTSIGDRDGRERILDAIDRLSPGGSTNAAEGLTLGYEMARRIYRRGEINRIILCSDGVANEGVTGAESILEQARREADRGIELTAIGFGMGNYNDVLLEKLADKGDGNYYYVDRLDEAQRIFIEKLTGTMQTIARNAKVQVAFDPERVLRYRLLGFENRDIADRDFRNDRIDSGEIGSGHEVTALYEVKLSDRARRGPIATVRLRYARPDGGRREGGDTQEIRRSMDAQDVARSFDQASPRFQLDAAVAEFAEILRRSYWAKESRIADVLPLARRAADEIPGDPDVREFARIVGRAADLTDKLSPEERRERDSYDMPWSIERPEGEEQPER